MQPTPRTELFHVVETVIPLPNQQSTSSDNQSNCYYSIDGDRFGLGVRLGYIFQSLALILGNATRMGFASGRGNTATMAFALMVPFVYGCIRGTSVWEGEIPLFYPVVSAMCLPSLWWPVLGVDDGSMDALMQGGEDRRIDTVGWRMSREGADMRVRARRKRWKAALAVWGPYVALSGTYVLVMVIVVYGVLGNAWGKLDQRCDFRPGLIGIGAGRLAGRVEWAVYGVLGLLMGVGGLVLLGVRVWRQINNATGEWSEGGINITRREGKWESEEAAEPALKEKRRVVAWAVISTITLVLCIASVEVTVSRNRIEQPGFNGTDYGQWIACVVGAASLVKLSWSLGVWGRPCGWMEGDERSDDESAVIER